MFLVVIALGLAASAWAQSGSSDSLTITTYYPSPYGVYGTLKLHPRPKAAEPCREGEMVYDAPADPMAPRGIYVCNSTFQWQVVSVGGGGGLWSEDVASNAVYLTNPLRYVGIRNSNPQAQLDVNGTVRSGPPGEQALGTGRRMNVTFDFLRGYHVNIPNPFPSTTVATAGNITVTIAACNRYCGAGCFSWLSQCSGDLPGLGYHGGTAVEWDYTTQRGACVCF